MTDYASIQGRGLKVDDEPSTMKALTLAEGLTTAGASSIQSVAVGRGASTSAGGIDNPSNTGSVGIGFQALVSNTSGERNTVVGYLGLTAVTTGGYNTGIGYNVLHACTTGTNNTGLGYAALNFTTIGVGNIAIGYQPGHNNTTGSDNIAVGSNAMYYNTTGANNIAIGDRAMAVGTTPSAMTASYNVGIGRLTLASIKTGQQNVAIGDAAMLSFGSGSTNTAVGSNALAANATGGGNVALGFMAGTYETGSNAFYVDNQDRTDTAGDKAKALLYGTFDANPALQTLRINAVVTTPYALQSGGMLTNKGTVVAADNTFVTVITPTMAGRYVVAWTLGAYGSGGDYSGVAELIHDGVGPAYLVTSTAGANTAAQMSTTHFQIKQTSGSSQTLLWSYIYMPF